jgi:peptidyl-prolyl cis-trans isomerase SurA
MTQKSSGMRMLLLAGAALTFTISTAIAGQAQSAPAESAAAKSAGTASGEVTSNAVPVAEIVARINDNIISKQDLDRAQNELNEQAKEENWSPEEVEKHKQLLLSELIDQQLLLSRGKEMGVTGDDELIRRLDEIRKQNHLDSMEDLEKAAKSQGVSFEDFKANIRNTIITQQVIREEVGKSIRMTSADELAFYRAHAAQFDQPESVHLSEILLPAGTTEAEQAAALQRAQKIAEEMSKGSNFADMAKSVSTGPTAAQGGDLGVFKRGQLAPELEEKTFSLKTGGLTEPVLTKQGYVILKVDQHTAGGMQPFKDVQEQVEQQAYMERMQPALRAYLTKLREQAFIDIKPGFADVHASPNESHPVFSAYAPPAKKPKKSLQKERFHSKTQLASEREKQKKAAAAQAAADAKAPAGGPTAGAVKTYEKAEANPPPAPVVVPVAATPEAAEAKTRKTAQKTTKSKKSDSGKPVKVRFGQGQKAAQLPPPTETATATAPSGDAAATGQPTEAQTTQNMESHLTPESQEILGTATAKPERKSRLQNEPHVSKTQKEKAAELAKNANAPAPPGAEEVAQREVTTAPLGLNGDTAHPAKPVKAASTGEKRRLENEPKAPPKAPLKANPGTPGTEPVLTPEQQAAADQATADQAAADQAATGDAKPAPAPAAKKRHKLLGVI